jgi:hypothetical protein
MRLAVFVATLVAFAPTAFAVSPEDAYRAVRQRAIKRLQHPGEVQTDDQAYNHLETAALADLRRRVFAIVGPVKVEGFSDEQRSHAGTLSASPDQGLLDGVEIIAKGERGGELVVTTKTLLQNWLADWPTNVRTDSPKIKRPPWARTVEMAVKADSFYTSALNPEDGFNGVADMALPTPAGASLAVAKLGRWGPHTDSLVRPLLIVTVVKGRWVLIAAIPPVTNIAEIAACAAKAACADNAAERDPPALPEAWEPLIAACSKQAASPDVTETSPYGWGPFADPPFQAWRTCEREGLPAEPYFAQLKREAEAMSERLARAK